MNMYWLYDNGVLRHHNSRDDIDPESYRNCFWHIVIANTIKEIEQALVTPFPSPRMKNGYIFTHLTLEQVEGDDLVKLPVSVKPTLLPEIKTAVPAQLPLF